MYINQTTYTKDKQRQLSAFTYRKKVIPMLVVLETIFALLIIYGAIFDQVTLLIIGIMLAIIIPIELILLYQWLGKRNLKKNPFALSEPTLKFTLEDTQLLIEQIHEDQSLGKLSYDFIYMGAEDLFNFYLFPNPMVAYILDKKGFETGSIPEIRAFLKARLRKTYFSNKPY